MNISFAKYQGAGNDFVVIDNRSHFFDKSDTRLVSFLCDRRFGIGADGLMLLEPHAGYDFEMVYFNSDGNPSSMCGNGGRCIVDFARTLGLTKNKAHFLAVDGAHDAMAEGELVRLKMNDVLHIEEINGGFVLDTGSPHFITFVKGLALFDVYSEGQRIRNSSRFLQDGINVNFCECEPGLLHVRTYERGVEDETLACGTGVTASVLVAAMTGVGGKGGKCQVKTPGGDLTVYYKQTGIDSFTDIWLEGPARKVFEGQITV
jgi:diaminopimelate epimerase